jgi:ABC-type sugar transport system ATPase subunit
MIRVEGLQVRAGDFSLVIDQLNVAPGEYLMILGPTAAGKTVLLEAVAGLRRPAAGTVWFGPRDVTAEPPERRRTGLVYQNYALFPHLTVAENIGFGLRRANRGRVHELAELLRIGHMLDRNPEGLSGGEQQRVALARALAVEPELLLLDEPLSALDAPTRLELRGELKRLHQELGATVMHVTHDLDEAMALGDKVAVLISGELRQVGPPGQVTRSPADVQVAVLVGAANIFPVAEVAGDPGEERWRARLRSGHELAVGGVQGVDGPAGDRWMVIRAEEIEIERAAEGPVVDGYDPLSRAAALGDVAPAENILGGVVTLIQEQSVHARIEVQLSPAGSGEPVAMTVNTLRPQVDRMQLALGSPVTLRISPSAVHLCPDRRSTRSGAPVHGGVG